MPQLDGYLLPHSRLYHGGFRMMGNHTLGLSSPSQQDFCTCIRDTTGLKNSIAGLILSAFRTLEPRIPVSSQTLRTLDYALFCHNAPPLPSCSASTGRYLHTLHIACALSWSGNLYAGSPFAYTLALTLCGIASGCVNLSVCGIVCGTLFGLSWCSAWRSSVRLYRVHHCRWEISSAQSLKRHCYLFVLRLARPEHHTLYRHIYLRLHLASLLLSSLCPLSPSSENIRTTNLEWASTKVFDAHSKLTSGSSLSVNNDYGDVYDQYYALSGDGYTMKELMDYADFLKKELVLAQEVARVSIPE